MDSILWFSGQHVTYSVVHLAQALRYKLEGCGFGFRWGHCIFYSHNSSGRSTALGSTQPLTEMSYLLTNYMEQSASLKANRFSASQEIPSIL